MEVATVCAFVNREHDGSDATSPQLFGLGTDCRDDARDLHIAQVQDVGGTRRVFGDSADKADRNAGNVDNP